MKTRIQKISWPIVTMYLAVSMFIACCVLFSSCSPKAYNPAVKGRPHQKWTYAPSCRIQCFAKY